MRTRLVIAVVVVVTAACTAACTGGVDNAAIKIKDMSPRMSIVSALEVGGSKVSVQLDAGDNAYELQSGDSLTVAAGDEAPVDLAAKNGHYNADLTMKDAGIPVTIGLQANGDDAPESSVTMTEQLAMATPPGTFSRGSNAVTVAWISDPSEDPLSLSWAGACVDDGSIDVDHTKTEATAPAGAVKKASGGDDSCDVAFTITRTRTGALDKHFKGGSITHSFSSSVHMTSNP